MQKILLPLVVILFVAVLLLFNAAFIVQEGEQALVFQFGKIQGKPKTQAGLYFLIPFIQNRVILQKRILNWDGKPTRVPTGDKKYISVDTTARYKIVDALLFRNSLRSVDEGEYQIKNVIDSATKDVISSHNLVEAVRNTDSILAKIKKKADARKLAEAQGTLEAIEEEVTGEIAPVKVGREKLSQMIIKKARPALEKWGLSLIDVQLRRIAYEKSVEEKVYLRMISERERIAEKIRSVGKGEQAKIRGKLSKDIQKIESEAYRKVQNIKGKAEAGAIKIYAESFEKDPSFYEFIRTTEAYKKGLRNDTKMILSADSAFMKLLSEGAKK